MKHLAVAALYLCFIDSIRSAPVTRDSKTPEIRWSNCTEEDPPNLQCGQLQVPLDYSKPNGDKIVLGLSRIKSTSNENRIGSLFLNPGGPGGVTTSLCIYQALGAIDFFPSHLTDKFDIICPDPRGIGASTPVQCDPELWNERLTTFPQDEAAYEKLVKHNKALGESCLNLTGPLLYHVDTTSAAKDLEQIRIALNDGKLNMLGLSYGTQLGGAYAELYPEKIRVMSLDGGLDHSVCPLNASMIESSTYDDVLGRFFDWCSHNSSCALHGQEQTPTVLFDKLVAAADKSPIPAPGCKVSGACRTDVTVEELLYNVQGELAFKNPLPEVSTGWIGLGLALSEALSGNATLLSTPLMKSAMPDPTALASPYAQRVIGCLDWNAPDTDFTKQYRTQQILRSLHPRTRGASQSYSLQTTCLGWPVNPDPSKAGIVPNPPHKLDPTAMEKVPPILIVNAEHDPSTNVVWAEGLHQQIPSSKLVLRQGDGHTSFLLGGEGEQVQIEYLLSGKLPTVDTVSS